jgi:hypothetical protein
MAQQSLKPWVKATQKSFAMHLNLLRGGQLPKCTKSCCNADRDFG